MKALPGLLACVALAAWPQTPPAPVASPDLTPVVVRRVAAEYSPAARQSGLQGTVLATLQVTPEGTVSDAWIVRGLAMGLDESALAAVKQWQYAPKYAGGSPRTKTEAITVEIPFLLDPPAPWQVDGAILTVPGANTIRDVVVKPEFSRYQSPDPAACTQDPAYVVLNFEIDSSGAPASLQVSQDPGNPVAQSALKAAGSWRFRPATVNRRPRASKATIVLLCGTKPADDDDFNAPLYRVGGGVTAPAIVFKVDPDYSTQARQAKYQGDVSVSLIVEKSGKPSHVRVLRPLGMGLDERAVAAAMQWRFKPGRKDGQPVRIPATIGISFRLL